MIKNGFKFQKKQANMKLKKLKPTTLFIYKSSKVQNYMDTTTSQQGDPTTSLSTTTVSGIGFRNAR